MDDFNHLNDCTELSGTALRKKYRTEETSHRAMLSRRKTGTTVSPELIRFRDFLRYVGPCPEPGYTIDRLNNDDPEYAPGKVAWRSKRDQANNRSNTVYLTDLDGTKRGLAEWAALKGAPRSTMYARIRRGYPDPEVIHGSQGKSAINKRHPSRHFPWPKGVEARWEERYRQIAKPVPYSHPGYSHRESRAEFMKRIAACKYRALLEIAESTVDPNFVPGPEHDQLFKDIDGWAKVLRTANRLLTLRH